MFTKQLYMQSVSVCLLCVCICIIRAHVTLINDDGQNRNTMNAADKFMWELVVHLEIYRALLKCMKESLDKHVRPVIPIILPQTNYSLSVLLLSRDIQFTSVALYCYR